MPEPTRMSAYFVSAARAGSSQGGDRGSSGGSRCFTGNHLGYG